MIYKIEYVEDKLLENTYKEAISELNDFYEIHWCQNMPRLIIVPDRKTIDLLRETKTEAWVTGWSEWKNVFYIDRQNYEKESSKKYREDNYRASIKHELSHAFYSTLVQSKNNKPVWLCEGLAIYTSGQLAFKKKPDTFKNFLQYHNTGGGNVYSESGFAVEILINKFGKQKLLDLIKNTKGSPSEENFRNLFKETYGFDLAYEEFNRYLQKKD